MSAAALQRQAALAAAALLAALFVLVLDRPAEEPPPPAPPPTSEQRWETALVGIFGRSADGRTTTCGVLLTRETVGIAHPVLPCGVKLVLGARGHEVRTEVIDQGASGGATAFDVSAGLARELGIERRATVRWRFAG